MEIPDSVTSYGDIDRLVHEPARFQVMALLYVIESADFTFIMNQLGLTWGNLSAHITKLEGVVTWQWKKVVKGNARRRC